MRIPPFGISSYSTARLSFAQDIALCRTTGVQGIGIDAALKLRDGPRDLQRFRDSGLTATFCFPRTPSVLPVALASTPADPAVRVEQLCRDIRELAPFEPVCCVCASGAQGELEPARARELVVHGLRDAARTAADVGLQLAVEPLHTSLRADFTLVSSLPETAELLAEIDEPNIGILFDVWHLWDTENLLDDIHHYGPLLSGVHVNDWRQPTRSWCDRVLPGDGVANLPAILRALRESAFDGWYELEVFSDDGSFGHDFPDSLWKRDPVDMVREARAKFAQAWVAVA